MEPRIADVCTNLLQKLEEDAADKNTKLGRIENDAVSIKTR